MKYENLKNRTKEIGINIIKFCSKLPNKVEIQVIKRQIIRCCTSIGANYRAACQARSKKEFIAKLGIVQEEADETLYWLEILQKLDLNQDETISILHNETNQILSIVIVSIKTARTNS